MATYQEIQDQIKHLQQQAEKIRAAELHHIIAEVKAKIREHNLTAAQLGFSAAGSRGAKKKSAVVQYRKGDLTWSGAGRGRKPKWVVAAMAAGEDLEKYRVKH
ncbi:MAG: H-NS histone family protein [Burkholderiales bacterium]|nr:H-NS histone family protein [Burkholderiales bacterium]